MPSHARILGVIAAATILACVSGPAARAQSPDGKKDLTELGLEDLMNIPVYAASRHAQDPAEAPASVSVVTAAEIKAYGWTSVDEIVSSVPGFYASDDRSYTYVGVRGFSRPGDFNTRILLLIDGVRANEIIYDSSGLGTDFNMDVDLIDRVEIVRGPGSVLYGSNAFFAVVNVITRTGADLAGGEVAASAGTAKSYGGRLTYGGSLGGRGDFLVSGSSLGSHGADLYFPEYDSPLTNRGVAEGRDGLRLGTLFGAFRVDDWRFGVTYVNRVKPRPTAQYGTVFNNPLDEDIDVRLITDASYERAFGGAYEAVAHVTYQQYRYDGDYLFDWAGDGEPPDPLLNMDRVHARWWGVEGRLSSTAIARNRVTFGAEYRDHFDIAQRNYDEGLSTVYLDSRERMRVFGLYAQDEIRLSRAVILDAGARYDHVSPLDQGQASPRAGLILKPATGTVLKLLYGEAFRSPDAFELYYHDGNVTTKANPSLEPERIQTVEAVLDQKLPGSLRGIVSAYRYEIHDLISQVVDPVDGLLQYRNADMAEAKGIELALAGRAPGIAEGRLSYSYVDARYSGWDARLSNSPQHVAKLNCMTAPVAGKVRAAFEVQHVGDRLTRSGSTVKRYTVAHANLTAEHLAGGLEVSAGVLNLFDERYRYPAGGEFTQDAVEADGRTYRLKCLWAF